MRLGLLLLVALAGSTGSLAAQARLEAGSRVRIVVERGVVPGRRDLQGTVVTILTDTLTLMTREGATHSVHVRTIRELYGFAPRDPRRSARRGALAGAFTGFGIGFVSGPLISSGISDDRLVVTTALSSGAGLVLGGVIGGVSGWMFAGDGWQKYQLPNEWRPAASVTRDGRVRVELRIPLDAS